MAYPVPLWYDWNVKISSFDAGAGRLLRPSNQMKLQQEVGELQLQQGGIDYQEMFSHNMVFIVTRACSVIHRCPVLDEQVTVRTWHRVTKGVQMLRCYQFFDADGKVLIESSSAFAIVDPVHHKIVRPSVYFDQFGHQEKPDWDVDCPPPAKLILPEELSPLGTRTVRWSDLDYNGHMNNTNYADIMCDFLPGGMEGRRITGFAISYLKEACAGEELTLTGRDDNGTAWILAKNGDQPCFDARIDYAPLA